MVKIPPRILKKSLKNKNKQLNGNGKGKGNGRGVKKVVKPSSLKQKSVSTRSVSADELRWKPVEIPDTLDDFGGFYGLEEIDGVGVKVINGRVEFSVGDDNKIAKENSKEDQEELKDIEMSDVDQNQVIEDEEEEEKKIPVINSSKKNKINKKQSQQQNEFESLPDLPEDVHLPEWESDSLKLSPYILQSLSKLGFTKPTPIQKKTIPLAISGKDVIGKAITGSGKTLAYGIPILEKYLIKIASGKIIRDKNNPIPPTGIIFTPTRELAHQVVQHLQNLAKYSPLTSRGVVSITGGLSIQKQERLLSHSPGIVIATPGRMLELIEKNADLAKRLASTDIIVLDEADRLLQDGHFEELEKIIDLFFKMRTKNDIELDYKWQTLVFSATFSKDLFGKLDKHKKNDKKNGNNNNNANGLSLVDDEEILKLLSAKLKFKDKKPSLVDVNPKEMVASQVTEALIECGATERDLYLYYFLLMYPGTTLVFANSIDAVRRLAPFLTNLKIPSFSIHSKMIQKQRLRALERFKAASENNNQAVLIASDVAARGLDIPGITHVVHYHLPRTADVYIHRSGRTARGSNEGVSVMLCSPQEAGGPLQRLRKLVASNRGRNSKKYNMRFNMSDVKSLPIEMDIVSQLKPRVKLASELTDAENASSGLQKENSWVSIAAEELGIEELSDMEEDDYLKRHRKRIEHKSLDKQDVKMKKLELKQLLDQSIRKDLRRSYLTGGLSNLAAMLVKGEGHNQIVGLENATALEDLKVNKKRKKQKNLLM